MAWMGCYNSHCVAFCGWCMHGFGRPYCPCISPGTLCLQLFFFFCPPSIRSFTNSIFNLMFACSRNSWRTGNIFGEYHYTSILGPRILGVPVVIGTNWLLLSYCFSALVLWWRPSLKWIYQVVLGASLMVLLDVIIEPFAVHYGLWIWKGRVLPSLANYVAWFFGGCIVTAIWLNFWQKTSDLRFLSSKMTTNERNVDLIKNNDILLVTISFLVMFFVLSLAGIMLS